jgi:hypothetical protein
MATAKSKKNTNKQKDPNATPRLKFGPVKKEVSKEEYENAVAEVQTAWRTHQVSARDFGCKLFKLRKLMYHGQFTKWLRANSIDVNHASYCMRNFLGLDKKAKERIQNLPQSVVKKQIDALFAPAEEKLPVQVSGQVATFILETCAQLGKASGWTFKPGIVDEKRSFSPIAEATSTALAGPLAKAVSKLLDELFVWEEFFEPENQATTKVPPAGKKSQRHAMQARAAAAAAGGPPNKPLYSSTPPPVVGQDK